MRFQNFLALFFLLAFTASALAVIQHAEMKIFAVTTDGQGLSADLILNITEGSGKVWSSVVPLVGTTTQNAETVAVNLAKNYSGDIGKYDYLFEIKSNASVVEGPSAGSAMALLVVSSLKDRKIPQTVGLTGTVSEDASIGPVGGVFEKSKEAARIGIKLFMIPVGEARQTVKLPEGVQSISLPDYALSEWGMKVIEVSSLDDALKLAFSDIGKIDINKSQQAAELVFVPSPIKQASSLQPLQKLTKNYLAETKTLIDSARNSLSSTLITDTSVINSLLSQLGDTEDALKEAQTLYDNNYLYSAANYTFLARVNALTIKDIAENPSILSENSTVLKLKVDALKEKIEKLGEELSGAIPVEGFEWLASSQQRLTWARINIEKLSQPETVIVINGVQQPASETAVKNIQDFEFAQAWFEIASNFYDFSRNSEKFAKPNDFFKQELGDYIVKAENGLSILQNEDNEDILRRVNSAKIQKEFKWNLGGVFDAASALALIDAENSVKGKDSNSLEKTIDDKIKALDSEIKDLNFQPVWANLYLDHARYYLNAGRFYSENNQGSRAAEMLRSGLSLVFLAESNLKVSEQAFQHYSSIDVNELTSRPVGSNGAGISVTVTPESNNFLFYLVVILGIGLAAAIVLIIVIIAKRSRNNSEIVLYESLSQKQKALALNYAEGKVSAEEFLSESRKLSEQSSKVEVPALSKSRHTIELDYLHSKLSALDRSLRLLKRDYNAGKILDSDYHNALKNIKAEISGIQNSLSTEPHPEEKLEKPRSSKALEEIAKEVKKPAKKKLKKKGKK